MTTIAVSMRQILRGSAIAIGSLLALLILAVLIKLSHFYYTEVRSYRADVENILANAETEHHNLPMQMQTMIDADFYCLENPESRPIFNFNPNCCMIKEGRVAQLIQYHPLAEYKPKRTLINHLHHIMLTYFIVRPLSQNEQNTLISELTFFTPKITSFNQFSMFYFYKPLSQLTLEEIATLVAFTKAPSIYLQNNERLQARQQYLLEHYDLLKARQ